MVLRSLGLSVQGVGLAGAQRGAAEVMEEPGAQTRAQAHVQAEAD